MDEDKIVIIDDGEPTDTGDGTMTPSADEEPVPDVDDDAERQDEDWDETGVEDDANAQQTFTSQPVPPYRPGDLWENSGETYICINGKDVGESFAVADWVPAEVVVPTPTTTVRTVTHTEVIDDFSAESLASYQSRGAVAYALYDDGTRAQVQWSQVQEPTPTIPDTVANEAAAVAAAINQHFWSRATDPDQDGAGTGAFVTDDEQDDFLAAAAQGFPDWGDGTQGTKPWHNLLMNSLGILLRTALNNLVSITKSAIAFFDGTGNQAGNVVASFGSNGAQIGKSDESHVIIGSNSIKMSESTSNLFTIEFDGLVNIINSGGDTSAKPYSNNDINSIAAMLNTGYTVNDSIVFDPEGNRTLYTIARNVVNNRFGNMICSPNLYIYYDDTSGIFEPSTLMTPQVDHDSIPTLIAMGETSVKATGDNLEIYAGGIATGNNSIASGQYSHAEGVVCRVGNNVYSTTASGTASHAEGCGTAASGYSSHSEGQLTEASGSHSHAEGYSAKAQGGYSHSEGRLTKATGQEAHAQNVGTIAASRAQTALGRYNIEDANDTYAVIVGNGGYAAGDARSNALTVDWDGNAELAGLVKATKDSGTVTLSGASGSVTAYSSGSTATVRGYGVTVDSALASGSVVTIGTVAAGFRPPLAMYATCASVNATACGKIMVTVNTNGTVQLTNRSGASLATTSALYFTVTYVI